MRKYSRIPTFGSGSKLMRPQRPWWIALYKGKETGKKVQKGYTQRYEI